MSRVEAYLASRQSLYAPNHGEMNRIIEESIESMIYLKLTTPQKNYLKEPV